MPTDELLTSTQAGAILGKSGRTVTRMSEAGKIPVALRVPGPNGANLYRRSDVEALLTPATAQGESSRPQVPRTRPRKTA